LIVIPSKLRRFAGVKPAAESPSECEGPDAARDLSEPRQAGVGQASRFSQRNNGAFGSLPFSNCTTRDFHPVKGLAVF